MRKMPANPYEYTGMLASTWDLLRGDTSDWPDREFYRSFIERSGQPALDVGCATGRLLLDYLGQGIDIDGVDISPEMLAICRMKASSLGLNPNLYQQSMEDLSLPRRYRTVVVSSSSFQLLTDLKEARKAMERFVDHLTPGGGVVMSFMILGRNEQDAAAADDWELIAEETRADDGAIIRRWFRTRFDYEEQLEHTEDRFEVWLDGAKIDEEHHSRSPATRWYTLDQAAELYESAGLVNVRAVKGFSMEPAGSEDSLFCVFGAKPDN